MSLTTHPGITRKVAAACGAAVLLLGAAACGSGDKNATGQTGEQGGPQNQQGGGPNGPNGPGGRLPGANGKVAAVDGRTAQVQGMEGQVAVSWTDATTFTKEVGARLSDIKVGDCVAVGSSDTPSSGSTPTSAVTAATVRIIARTNGSCAPTMRGPGAQDGTGPQTYGGPPTGSGGGGQRAPMRVGGAVGEVKAVSATGFTVDSVVPGSNSSATTSVAVTVGAGTTYTTTAKGAASDVKVGTCVAADGTTDQTGAVTARTIAISQPQDGQCGGFMRLRSDAGGSSSQAS
jgi:hypothetical protein